jgi:hypothetical protein
MALVARCRLPCRPERETRAGESLPRPLDVAWIALDVGGRVGALHVSKGGLVVVQQCVLNGALPFAYLYA